MLCQCGEREATIHEVVIKAGRKVERHLCEVCARQAGMDVGTPATPVVAKVTVVQGPTCDACGTSISEFRHTGLLGCPACYRRFETQLTPLLERAHEGGTHHVGKVPLRLLQSMSGTPAGESLLGDAVERAARLGLLRQQLEEAVHAEQYERAAMIRDEIAKAADSHSGGPEPKP
ncbi:MAG: UvrB/UvrC motif-containing protein [Phycisphaeraceae bacterium]|nr:UvrB/UvrC motif-containing protein [Phycisphaeraceae bacterium]MCW5767334.1 UvrB/UvrC motif-containing protein [Phycisphaeraceae bacterium]